MSTPRRNWKKTTPVALNYISETVNNDFMSTQYAIPSRICNYDRRYSRRVPVVVRSVEVADPTVEAINREIYVDKFDNINRGIVLTDPGEQCRIGV